MTTLEIVAVTSFDSATVDERVVVNTPVASLVPVSEPVVLPVPPIVSDTDAPDTRLPLPSFAVTVMRLWLAPLDAVIGEVAVTVDWLAETDPAVMLKVELVAVVSPVDVADKV